MSRLLLGAALAMTLGWVAPTFGDVYMTLGIRETRNNFSPAIGSDGGTTNDHDCGCGVEWVGATSVTTGGAPQGVMVPADGQWHTVTFDLGNGPIVPYSGEADGILYAMHTYSPIEHLAIASAGTAGPHQMYIDNVRTILGLPRGQTSTVVLTSFEGSDDGTEEMFQEPSFVVPDGAGPDPAHVTGFNQSVVTSADAYDGSKSTLVEWTFTDDSPDRWVRLSTYTPSPRDPADPDYLPLGNPNILLPVTYNRWVEVDVRLVPEPGTGGLLAVLAVAFLRRRRRPGRS